MLRIPFAPSMPTSESLRTTESPLQLSRFAESKVVELAFCDTNVWPSVCEGNREVESQAKPAALEAAGGRKLRPPDDLEGLDGFFPSLVRNVVSIRPFLSGLGVLEIRFVGTGSVGGGGGGKNGAEDAVNGA